MRKWLLLLILWYPALSFAQFSFSNGTSWLEFDALRSGLPIGVADMNSDGLEDLIILDNARDLYIEYQQADTTAFNGVYFGPLNGPSWSLCIADADNNGFPDMFTGGAYNGLKILLANADGSDYSTAFPDVPLIFLKGANFADMDNDGDVDIFAAHADGLSVPLRNDSAVFTPDYDLLLPESSVPSDNSGNSGTVWTDFDLDGRSDLYISKFKPEADNPFDGRRLNLLFRNEGEDGFTQVAPQANAQPLGQSWASNFADIDNDGDMDGFVINHDIVNTLYRNNGNGTFTNITAISGVQSALINSGLASQVLFGDFDNDGFVDILLTALSAQHLLLHNDGDGTFTKADNPFPTTQGIHSAVLGDFNQDGFLDVYAGFGSGFNQIGAEPDQLFINDANTNHYCRVRLRGIDANSSGVGARVELYGSWGVQAREIRSGESLGINSSLTAHFGLGDTGSIDSMIIRWPNGNIDFLENPAADTTYLVIEGQYCLPQAFFTYEVEGLTLQFTPQVDLGADTLIWDWGDGSIDTLPADILPMHTFPDVGNYTVCLTTQGSCGTTTYCEEVPVLCPTLEPNFNFEADGLDVSFSDFSFGNPTSWLWEFGEEGTSNEQNPDFGFDEPGVYFVCLTVGSDCGTAAICKFVEVACGQITTAFDYSEDGLTVQFTDFSSSGTNSWFWTFGDGSVSGLPNPEHTFPAPGAYEVCLTINGVCGSGEYCETLNVSCAPPEADFLAFDNGLSVLFADNSSNAPDQYSWDFGDGATSEESSPTHVYNAPGTYLACLSVSSICGSDTSCTAVTVSCAPPEPGFIWDSSSLLASFQNTTDGAYDSLLWVVEGQDTLLGESPSYLFSAPGIYEVCLQASNVCGSATYCEQVTVSCQQPEAGFDYEIEALTGTFTDTSLFSPTQWAWRIDGAPAGFDSLLVYEFPAAGTYTVCLQASSVCGESEACREVEALCAPPASGYTSTANGLSYQFTSTAADNTVAWFWDFGDGGSSFEENPQHSFSNPGTYTVCLEVSNACGEQDEFCRQETVGCAAPQAAFSSETELLSASFTDNSSNNPLEWQWSFGDGNASTQQNPSHTYGGPGTYEVCLTAISVCGSTQQCEMLTITCPEPETGFIVVQDGLTVNLQDTSLNSPTIWSWDFGDGNGSELQNPEHTFEQPGDYTICLLASSVCGSGQRCQSVSLSCPAPQAAFSFDKQELQVSFADASLLQPEEWLWDFGDGNTSAQQNPSHTYGEPGTYEVCLSVSSVCGSSTECLSVSVSCAAPQAAFEVEQDELQLSFTDQSDESTAEWLWTFGDGSSSNEPSPTYQYNEPGTYQVCLQASSICGSTTSCETITVSCTAPQAAFSSETEALQVAFSSEAEPGPENWSWNFGDGSVSDMPNPVHTYDMPGTYTVCLEVSSVCGSTQACSAVTVSCAAPQAGFILEAAQLELSFTDVSENGPSNWLWDFGDGNTSTAQNPVHTYSEPGTYEVCLQASSICGSTASCQTVTVNCMAPQALFSTEADELTLFFTDLSDNNPQSWAWNFGDGTTSTAQNPQHTYNSPGEYLVCLVVSSVCGSTQRCELITASCTPPQAAFNFEADELTVEFEDDSALDPVAWFWAFGDGTTSTQANPVHEYELPGTYEACLTVSNECGSTQQCQEISLVCAPPEPQFSYTAEGATVFFEDETEDEVQTYVWDFGDGQISGEAEPVHTYDSSGTYLVCLSTINVCGNTTACQLVEVIISSAREASGLRPPELFPNPARGQATVVTSGWVAQRLLLYDTYGQLLRSQQPVGTRTDLSLEGLPSGLYLLRVQQGQRWYERRLIKQE